MKERFKTYGYEITTDGRFQNKRLGVTPELENQLESLGIESQDKKNKKIIDKLTQLIIQYPLVPILKNYLSVAYQVQGNHKKALEVNNWLISEHPDYLFAKLNQANVWMDEGEFEKVPLLLGEAMEIKQLYPERDVFHIAEVRGFLLLAIRYFTGIGNLELAENRFEILKKIAPDHPDIERAELYLLPLRLKTSTLRREKKQQQRIVPEPGKSKQVSMKKDAPQFNHPQINNLYHYGINIPHAKLREILSLPRITLIDDLEKVLEDSVERYDYFDELGYQEETHSFVLHAIFLLKELKAIESLPIILALLLLDEDFLELWLGDHKTGTLWQCLYTLGLPNPEVYTTFLLTPEIDTFSKTAVSQALCQMVLHHPEMRDQIAAIYMEVFTAFSQASLEDNLLDPVFLGLAIGDAIDCRLHGLLPIIKDLYDKQYVSLDINGDYLEVEKDFSKVSGYRKKQDIYSIFELYDNVLSTWDGYIEDKKDISRSKQIPQQGVFEKVGRNDDCPCGSGKKYKKCCGKLI